MMAMVRLHSLLRLGAVPARPGRAPGPFKSDLRNHQAIAQPRGPSVLRVICVTIKQSYYYIVQPRFYHGLVVVNADHSSSLGLPC